MTDSTLTPPAADMMSFLSTTPEHKDSEYETPVHTSQRTELNVIVEDGPDSKLRLAEISAAANPLLAAARPLLCALAAMPAKLDAALVEPYRNLLVREMHLYQTLCDQANLRREHVLAVRYCLCPGGCSFRYCCRRRSAAFMFVCCWMITIRLVWMIRCACWIAILISKYVCLILSLFVSYARWDKRRILRG